MLLQYFGFVINFEKGDIPVPPPGCIVCTITVCWRLVMLLRLKFMVSDILTWVKEYLQHVDKNAFQWNAYRPLVDHMWGVSPGGVFVQDGGRLPGMGSVWLGRGLSVLDGGCLPGMGGVCPGWGVSAQGVVPCDLSHHAFDVTFMLPPHQLRPSSSAATYILLVSHVTCKAYWHTHPHVDRQTHVKT